MRKLILSLLPMLGLIAGSCGGKTDAKTIDMKSESASTGATALNENPADTSSVKVAVKTTEGDFEILLYGDTPKHRDNFVKLVKENYYDGTLFHRVINEFMVQAGDPESRNDPAGKHLGAGGPGYQIDAEFVYPARFHKRGALAAARTGDQMNPERKSSGSQFYVVTGKTYTPAELDQMEQQMIQQQFYSLAQKRRNDIMRMQKANDEAGLNALQEELIAQATELSKFTPQQREAYTTVGGTPFLDAQYTVFGEVLSGMDTIEKIEKTRTDRSDRPASDIKILSMKIIE